MTIALVALFREDPAQLAHYGVLNQLLQWACVVGIVVARRVGVAGLRGLLWGSFAGSLLVATALRSRSRRGRFRGALFVDLFRVGRSQAVYSMIENARPLLVLLVMNGLGPGKSE